MVYTTIYVAIVETLTVVVDWWWWWLWRADLAEHAPDFGGVLKG